MNGLRSLSQLPLTNHIHIAPSNNSLRAPRSWHAPYFTAAHDKAFHVSYIEQD